MDLNALVKCKFFPFPFSLNIIDKKNAHIFHYMIKFVYVFTYPDLLPYLCFWLRLMAGNYALEHFPDDYVKNKS